MKKVKKCKGVKKLVVKKSIAHEDYTKCLFTGKEQLRKMNVIRSHRHEVYTEEVNKVDYALAMIKGIYWRMVCIPSVGALYDINNYFL